MKLRQNSKNWRLVEDDFGNPVFEFVGTNFSDLEQIIKAFNNSYYQPYFSNR
jgi:hypothetical protein